MRIGALRNDRGGINHACKSVKAFMPYFPLLVVFVILAFIGGCSENEECAACPETQPVIELNSGTVTGGSLGVCPYDHDSLTYVTSVCNEGPPVPALIWKGHQSDSCRCGNLHHEIGGANSQPVSADCISAIQATFTRTFTMPANFKWVKMNLAVAVDDWVIVYLNNHSIGIIDLSQSSGYPASGAIFVADSSLFVEGTNTLRFEAGNGIYPNVRSRTTSEDCFWVQYSGTVEYGF